MSSTYVHYTSSSLPSDYALLSRYSATQPDPTTDASQSEQAEASSVAPSSHVDEDEDEDEESGVPIQANGTPRPLTQRRSSLPSSRLPSSNSTMSPLPDRHGHRSGPYPKKATENTPLLTPPVPRIEEECDTVPHDGMPRFSSMFKEEMAILMKYTLPVFGYVHVNHPSTVPYCNDSPVGTRTHLFEYSLVVASVISIGHLSTTALAASTLGSMTASVSGFSIIQGFASTLDTMLPSAWTSSQPQLVGLWSQRMGECHFTERSRDTVGSASVTSSRSSSHHLTRPDSICPL